MITLFSLHGVNHYILNIYKVLKSSVVGGEGFYQLWQLKTAIIVNFLFGRVRIRIKLYE